MTEELRMSSNIINAWCRGIDAVLADGAGATHAQPLIHARRMEAMEARQSLLLVARRELLDADGALLVLGRCEVDLLVRQLVRGEKGYLGRLGWPRCLVRYLVLEHLPKELRGLRREARTPRRRASATGRGASLEAETGHAARPECRSNETQQNGACNGAADALA